MTTISATMIEDSLNSYTRTNRLSTMLLRYPRCIHAEFMTHRAFSRNAASSRAIPVQKLIADVEADPFVPLVWTKNRPGMQATEELTGIELQTAKDEWNRALENALESARLLASTGAHKQLVNRILEPFAHITVVVSATEWANFFALRRHAAAEPHMHMLADSIWDAMQESVPTQREYHLPFVTEHERNCLGFGDMFDLSVARCASTSYKTVDGFDMTLERARALVAKLHDRPMHASPFEHQAVCSLDRDLHSGNFIGWKQYRQSFAHQYVKEAA